MHTTSSPNEGTTSPRKGLPVLSAAIVVCFGLAIVSSIDTASATTTTYATVSGYALASAANNNPDTWGDNCYKVEEPGGSSYVLPAGTYTKVIVKAGANQDGNFANTIFAAPPLAGQTVWADTNGDGLYNPGGKDGDKTISHVILCKGTPSESSGPPSTPETTPVSTPVTTPVTTPASTPATTPVSTPPTSASTTVTENPCDFQSPAPASCSPTTHTSGPPVVTSLPPSTFTGGVHPPVNGGATGPTGPLTGNDSVLSSSAIAAILAAMLLLMASLGINYRRRHRGARE